MFLMRSDISLYYSMVSAIVGRGRGMMLKTKVASTRTLERTVAKYENKLARAANPTQKQYASRMLHMARQALAESRTGEPETEARDADVVTLHRSEYEVS